MGLTLLLMILLFIKAAIIDAGYRQKVHDYSLGDSYLGEDIFRIEAQIKLYREKIEELEHTKAILIKRKTNIEEVVFENGKG